MHFSHFFDGKALGTGFEERRFATLWYTWYAQATTQVFNLFLFISVTYIFRYRLASLSCQPTRSARATHTHVSRSSVVSEQCTLGCLKAVGKRATCFAELHKIELKSHVARFIPPTVKPVFQQIRLLQVCHVRSLLQTACVPWKRNLENSFLNHFWSARRITYWGFYLLLWFQRLDILFIISNLSYVLFVCLCTLRLKNPDWENQ